MRAALWMGGALLTFSLMAVAVRELSRTLGTFEILFLRSGVSLALVLAMLPYFGLRPLRTQRFPLHVVRNLFHFAGQFSWVYAIGLLPLATVFAIEFTAPIWTAVLAVLFLGEHMNRGRAVMLALGLAGVLVILRPGLGVFQPAALVMLAGSLFFAIQFIGTPPSSEPNARSVSSRDFG